MNKQIDGITYRLFDKQYDYEKIDKMSKECFPEVYWNSVFKDYVNWNDHSPSGPGMQLSACDGNKVIGVLNFLKQTIVGFGKSYYGVLATRAMTDISYRRKGIYRNLTQVAFSEFKKRDISFAFGYTVRPSVLKAELKIGYSLIGNANVLIIPLKPFKLLSSKLNFDWLKITNDLPGRLISDSYIWLKLLRKPTNTHITVEEVDKFSTDINIIFNEKRDMNQYEVMKDADTINWKYRQYYNQLEPHRFLVAKKQGNTVGFGVCGRINFNGVTALGIFDAHGITEIEDIVIMEILKRQIQLAKQIDVDTIVCMVDKYSSLRRILNKIGFLRTPYNFKTIFMPLSKDIPPSLKNQCYWRHTWGNSDTL